MSENLQVTVIFPMAGRGARFGYEFKPLLKLEDKTFIERAVNSFEECLEHIKEIVFVFLEEQEKEYNVSNRLKEMFPELNYRVVLLEKPTASHVETIKKGIEKGNINGKVIICDTDHYLDTKPIFDHLLNSDLDECVAPLWDLKDENVKSWCIVSTSNEGKILDIAEKEFPKTPGEFFGVIGCYYFKDTSTLLYGGEHVSEIIKNLIQTNKKVSGVRIKNAEFFGDPERLQKTLKKRAQERKIDENLLETMKRAVMKAGKIIENNQGISFERKEVSDKYEGFDKIGKSFVTNIDLTAQKIILRELLSFNNFSVLAEEEDDEIKEILLNFNPTSNYKFVIDPLDGTANYLTNNQEIKKLLSEKYFEEHNEEMPDNSDKFGTCISLTKDNMPIYTVIHYPRFDETLWSIKGYNTFIEGKKINVPEKKEHEFSDAIRISQYSKINKFKHLFTNRKSYHSSAYNLRALLNEELLTYCTDSIDYLDFCPALLAFIEAGGFIGDENANPVDIENLVKEMDKDGRLNQFMILCPNQEYCKSLLMNLKEKGFSFFS